MQVVDPSLPATNESTLPFTLGFPANEIREVMAVASYNSDKGGDIEFTIEGVVPTGETIYTHIHGFGVADLIKVLTKTYVQQC